MNKIITAATAAFLLALSGPAFAEEAKAPADKGECLKMLREIGPNIAKANLDATTMEGLKAKGQEMAKLCGEDKLTEAFAVYQELSKAAAGK